MPVVPPASNTRAPVSRAEYAAEILQQLAEKACPDKHLGTKVALRARCQVSVSSFNEAVKLAQSRGYITSRPGPGGGIFAAERSPLVRLGNSVLALDGQATDVADAIRMRDALDPLLIDDAVRHSGSTAIGEMRDCLAAMAAGRDRGDAVQFLRANWALHRRIAQVSPSAILCSVYLSLLELIEGHTVDVDGVEQQPLPEYVDARYDLHEQLVDAIEARNLSAARRIIDAHNTTGP